MIEEKIIAKYNDELEKYGSNDRRALFWTKDKQDMRFHILLGEEYKNSRMTLLDYGCGFADLNSFLIRNYYNLHYHGCDINQNFIKTAKKNHSDKNIFQIDSVNDISDNYDIILVSGTFNLIMLDNIQEMKMYVFAQLLKLFKKTDYMLTINFLSHSTDEDYKYNGHFYLDPTELYNFAISQMTTRIQIDTHSLPYEITFKFFKNQTIDKSLSVYKN